MRGRKEEKEEGVARREEKERDRSGLGGVAHVTTRPALRDILAATASGIDAGD